EDAELAHRVVGGVRRRQNLAYPVGQHADGAIPRSLRRALAPPSGEVVASPSGEVVAVGLMGLVEDLHLGHQPPSSRPSRTAADGTAKAEQRSAQTELRGAMIGAGRRLVDELAADELRRALLGKSEEIVRG